MEQHKPATDYTHIALGELAVLVQQGDRQAFRHIIERCNQRLFRVARAVLNDEDEAEDALQNAYLNAYQHITSYRGDAELSTWLTRIVLNECYQRLRKARPTVDIDTLEANQAQSRVINFPARYGVNDPAFDAARAQARELTEHAISDLPDAFRLVFMLRDVEGYSTQETASLLGIRAVTVKTRLFRARRQLRKALNDKLESVLSGTFPFLGQRCERLTRIVMLRLDAIPSTNADLKDPVSPSEPDNNRNR